MKQYLKMADVFGGAEVGIRKDAPSLVDCCGVLAANCLCPETAGHIAHAINSHDELVQMLAVMAELVGKMNCYCHQAGASANKNSENPVESWMAEADEALDAIRSAS